MSTTAAVIATTASVNASIAAAEARDAKEAAICNVVITGYSNDKATISEKVKYSECVQFMFPQKSNEPAPLWWKIDLVLMLILLIVGVVVAVKRFSYSDDLVDRVFQTAGWAVLGFLTWLLLNGIVFLVLYLLKG